VCSVIQKTKGFMLDSANIYNIAMSSVKLTVRTNQALQVIQCSNDGMSIIEACQEVGIARSTFYHFVNTHPDAIASIQEMRMVAALEQFALILENQTQILGRVIEDGLTDTTKPR
jgi:ACT domain-containing protein